MIEEPFWAVRDFIERGGTVLLEIALLTAVMWTLIVERAVYFRTSYQREKARALASWNARKDRASWEAHQIRRLLISRIRLNLESRLPLINTAVGLAVLSGLLGTVTGMIEVFDVMAVAGSGNVRGMAAGVSKATLPTMAGMVAALSGMMSSTQLERFARSETHRIADSLELAVE